MTEREDADRFASGATYEPRWLPDSERKSTVQVPREAATLYPEDENESD